MQTGVREGDGLVTITFTSAIDQSAALKDAVSGVGLINPVNPV
jgi:hypothetical protein